MILFIGAFGIFAVFMILFIGLSMVAPNLSVTKRIKGSLADAAAQTIIAIILTVGFVCVQILGGIGFMTIEGFNGVMSYYGPLYAIVVGFYFAVNVLRNGKSSETSSSSLELIMNMITSTQQATVSTDSQVAQLKKVMESIAESQNRMADILQAVVIKTAEKDKEPEEPEPKEPSTEDDPPGGPH